MNDVFITPHALERLRDHWPTETVLFSDKRLIKIMRARIEDALKQDKKVETPGGTFVPVTLEGRDGFAVLQEKQVVTFAPLEWCEEVTKVRNFF